MIITSIFILVSYAYPPHKSWDCVFDIYKIIIVSSILLLDPHKERSYDSYLFAHLSGQL